MSTNATPAVDIDGVLVQSGNNLENKYSLHGNANMSMPYGNDRMGDKIHNINGLEISEDSNVSQNNPLRDYRNIGDIVQCATEGVYKYLSSENNMA